MTSACSVDDQRVFTGCPSRVHGVDNGWLINYKDRHYQFAATIIVDTFFELELF